MQPDHGHGSICAQKTGISGAYEAEADGGRRSIFYQPPVVVVEGCPVGSPCEGIVGRARYPVLQERDCDIGGPNGRRADVSPETNGWPVDYWLSRLFRIHPNPV